MMGHGDPLSYLILSWFWLIDQFRYIKIQLKTINATSRLLGIK